MFKVNNKDTRTTPVAIINFEHVKADWETYKYLKHYQEIILTKYFLHVFEGYFCPEQVLARWVETELGGLIDVNVKSI